MACYFSVSEMQSGQSWIVWFRKERNDERLIKALPLLIFQESLCKGFKDLKEVHDIPSEYLERALASSETVLGLQLWCLRKNQETSVLRGYWGLEKKKRRG